MCLLPAISHSTWDFWGAPNNLHTEYYRPFTFSLILKLTAYSALLVFETLCREEMEGKGIQFWFPLAEAGTEYPQKTWSSPKISAVPIFFTGTEIPAKTLRMTFPKIFPSPFLLHGMLITALSSKHWLLSSFAPSWCFYPAHSFKSHCYPSWREHCFAPIPLRRNDQ